MSKTCIKCATNTIEWINKFSGKNRVYLDKLYFEENKVSYEEDDRGTYVSGQKFVEIELAKAHGRCPRCGCNDLKEETENGL
jgi:hypothetical protein